MDSERHCAMPLCPLPHSCREKPRLVPTLTPSPWFGVDDVGRAREFDGGWLFCVASRVCACRNRRVRGVAAAILARAHPAAHEEGSALHQRLQHRLRRPHTGHTRRECVPSQAPLREAAWLRDEWCALHMGCMQQARTSRASSSKSNLQMSCQAPLRDSRRCCIRSMHSAPARVWTVAECARASIDSLLLALADHLSPPWLSEIL